MNNLEKIRQLRDIVYARVSPLVGTDVVYLDLPYHYNSGDTLIWQGTLDFIKSLDLRCRLLTNANTWYADKAIGLCRRNHGSSTILLHGGGNFGDIWPMQQRFRNYVISNCPDVPVIILPQTIYYQDERNLSCDSELYKGRNNITICVRDNTSLEIAEKYFPDNNPVLVPDMAFCMDMDRYGLSSPERDNLFVRRTDKEYSETVRYDTVPSDADVSDWPTLYPRFQSQFDHSEALKWAARIDCRLSTHLRDRLTNHYWNTRIRQAIVESAISFVGSYRNIYTTRMHAAILSVLLNRDRIVLFDNSYGKSSSFADAWFGDLDNFIIRR